MPFLATAPNSVLATFAEQGDGVSARYRRLVTRTRERHADMRARLDAGQSLGAISRATGLDRKTVQRFARADGIDEVLVKAVNRESKLDEFKPWLHQRCNEGT